MKNEDWAAVDWPLLKVVAGVTAALGLIVLVIWGGVLFYWWSHLDAIIADNEVKIAAAEAELKRLEPVIEQHGSPAMRLWLHDYWAGTIWTTEEQP